MEVCVPTGRDSRFKAGGAKRMTSETPRYGPIKEQSLAKGELAVKMKIVNVMIGAVGKGCLLALRRAGYLTSLYTKNTLFCKS